MTTLKELYTTLKSLRDMNLPVDDKLLKAADNLEEKIIKERIRGRFFDPTVSTATHRVEDRRFIILGLAQFGMFNPLSSLWG